MNTQVEYHRHSHRPPTPVAPNHAVPHSAPHHSAPVLDSSTSHLAHHRDPSLAPTGAASPPAVPGVTWVRPTELAVYAAPIVGRGIDLEADLIRRARRAPASTARALPQAVGHPTATPSATLRPTSPQAPSPAPPVADTEGPSL